MTREIYERAKLNITEFDTEDVIATSGNEGGGTQTPPPAFTASLYEAPVVFVPHGF